jgi:hypothetical protein
VARGRQQVVAHRSNSQRGHKPDEGACERANESIAQRLRAKAKGLSEFAKSFRRVWKSTDGNRDALENHLNEFNSLARNPIGYRYTIPQ